MCTVSNVGDYWRDRLPNTHPWVVPYNPNPIPGINPSPMPGINPGMIDPLNNRTVIVQTIPPEVSKADIEALRNELEELKKLLKAAMKFDQATGQSECHMDAKVQMIKDVAKLVGVDMDEVFEPLQKKKKTVYRGKNG